MSVSNYRFAHIVVVTLFLLAVFSMGHLSWNACLRLGFITSGLIFLLWKYGRDLCNLGQAESHNQTNYWASALLGFLICFVITQYDPITSNQSLSLQSWSYFSILSTLLVVVLAGLFIVGGWWRIRLVNLTFIDKIIIGLVGLVVVVTIGSELLIASDLTIWSLVRLSKIVAYLVVWLVVTHVYTQPETAQIGIWKKSKWRDILGVCLFLFSLSLGYGVYRTGMVFYLFDKGQEAIKDAHIDEALVHYEDARALNQFVGLRFIEDRILEDLAVLYFRTGDVEGAQLLVISLGKSGYDNKAPLLKQGNVYFRAEQWANAIKTYREYLALAGKDTRVVDRLATAYAYTQDILALDKLIEDYEYVPQIETQSYQPNIFLGNYCFYRKQYDSALKYYQRAKDAELTAYVLYKLGRVYLSLNQYQNAETFLLNATEMMPIADAFYQLGRCYQDQLQNKKAYDFYQRAVRILPYHLDALLALNKLNSEY